MADGDKIAVLDGARTPIGDFGGALWSGAMQIRCGSADLVLAGGDESMSRMPFYDFGPRGSTRLGDRPTKRAELTAAIPMGRFAAPSEMCAAVAFLASGAAGYITGTVLPAGGGIAM